jgi:hypothetical protein
MIESPCCYVTGTVTDCTLRIRTEVGLSSKLSYAGAVSYHLLRSGNNEDL